MASSHLHLLALLFLSLSSLSLSQKCHPNDEKALLRFKKDLNNPRYLISWVPKTNCCNWSNVTCDNYKTNRITEIALAGANFHLPIPAAVGDIQFLRRLIFLKCNITGSIPEAISKLSQLDALLIRRNPLLTGPVPSSLGRLKKLIYIDLSENNLTGPVPSFLGRLKKLRHINLSENKLTGPMPASLSQLPLLENLLLKRNKLTGGVPESFGDFKGDGFALDLSDNRLSGPLPRSLWRVKFFILDVSRNRLAGDLSFMFVKNQTLQWTFYSRNMFKFDFSKVEFSDELTDLDLSHNQIYGSLPAGLTTSAIGMMSVAYNNLCGRIPVGGRLQDFGAAAFSNNRCLCGTPLPECK